MKKLWIVTELFYPEETSTAFILTKIANALSDKFDVNVICGPESYGRAALEDNPSTKLSLDGRIKIHRVSNCNLNKDKIFTRLLRFLIIGFKLSFSLWKNAKKQDRVFIVTNPAPLLISVALIKRIKKFPLYILVHDVFPENTIPAGVISSDKTFGYKLLRKCFNWAYKSADCLIVLGRDMRQIMKSKLGKNQNNTKIEIIENWAENDIAQLNPMNKSKNIVIQYAGNIGRVQGLKSFIQQYAEAMNPIVSLELWGDGAMRKELEEYAKENDVQNIFWGGKYSRSQQNEIFGRCDISLVTLSDGMFGLGVPSKSYNIMAASKPMGSGFYVAETTHLSFNNISMPYFGEGYINWGYLGVVLFAIVLAYVLAKLDKKYWTYTHYQGKTINKIKYFMLLGLLMFILRGDLLSSFAYTIGYMVSFEITKRIVQGKQ